MNSKYLIVIAGATAVGKTVAAIEIAKHLKTEIISADSRQFYREMTVGTAKPSIEELNVVPHHFINNLSIHDKYSVGQYEREVLSFLSEFYKQNDIAVLVGGTGLYINAIINGLDNFPDIPDYIKQQTENDYAKQGLSFLQSAVHEADPDYFSKVDINNPVRLIRALEVFRATGKPFSTFSTGVKYPRMFTPIFIKLELPREKLYARINSRVDSMMENNALLNEVLTLMPYKHLRPLQTVGYTEFFEYFDAQISIFETLDKIKQHTRNYAKRQITWFNRPEFANAFAPTNVSDIVRHIENVIRKA